MRSVASVETVVGAVSHLERADAHGRALALLAAVEAAAAVEHESLPSLVGVALGATDPALL